MDVRKGHCWRCEESIVGRSDICSQCEMATYCSVKCRQDDQYRHKPECEVWGPKKCCNPQCSVFGKLKECTGCNDAWYCGISCQQEDRPNHKTMCRERTQFVVSTAGLLRTRFRNRPDVPLRVPYYIGNALAIDMLNLQENECSKALGQEEREAAKTKDYSVLTAGCGNLRNVIHSVACLPQEFVGKIQVTLNDIDPFVQARNVLFLYMMVVFATQSDVATVLTTLWCSLHLSSKDYKLLTDCLNTLTQLTGSALADTTRGLVKVGEECMPQLREVWRGWLELQCLRSHPKSINLRKQRQEMFAKDPGACEGIALFKRVMPSEYLKSFEEWLESGVFYLSVADDQTNLDYDNPTMTGYNLRNEYTLSEVQQLLRSPRLQKFVYCVESDLNPFGEWDQLLVQRHTSTKSLVDLYHTYITNQVKQAVAYLSNERLIVTVYICNCLHLSSRLGLDAKFDRIFTSNIADYVGTKNLLRVFKGLLKTDNKCATIVTQYWNWYGMFPNACVDGDPVRARDGTLNTCVVAALNDTGEQNFENKPKDLKSLMQFMATMQKGKFFLQEYFNYMVYFINFMRSELMACDESIPLKKAVSFKEVLQTEGLQMVDFRRELNRVAPFAYRRNIRPINLLRGMERMVEWRLPG